MGERALQANDFPSPLGLVTALQSYLRRTPGAPEYGSIGGRGFDRVVYGPLFTTFVLEQTCQMQGQTVDTDSLQERSKKIQSATQKLRFDSGQIIPSIGRQVLHEYKDSGIADPHVEIARRLAIGLYEQDHDSNSVARDAQIMLSRVALDGGLAEVVPLPDPLEQTGMNNLQAAVPDVA